jgi:hypothetical protein
VGLIAGRFVEAPCPGCGVSTFPIPAHAGQLHCVNCGRLRHGAAPPRRPTPGANAGYRLGQGGVHAYPLAARRTPPPAPKVERRVLVLDGPRPGTTADALPRTVWALDGDVTIVDLLEPDGYGKNDPWTHGWKLVRRCAVRWHHDDCRGVACWRAQASGRWSPGGAVWREGSTLRYGKPSAVLASIKNRS